MLPLCAPLWLSASPGCYPLLCKQQNYMSAQLLMRLATALGCSYLIYGCKLHLPSHWSVPGNTCSTRERQNRRPCKSTAHFLIMWKTGVDSLLPQTLCRPCALLQILKVSPSAKAVRCIHILRVRVRNCIMKEQLGVIEQSFVGFHHTPSTGNTDVSKLKGYDILETAWIAQHPEFCTVYIIFDSS